VGGGTAVGASVGSTGAGANAVNVALTLASTSAWSRVGGGASVGLLQAANKKINRKASIGIVFFIINLLSIKNILNYIRILLINVINIVSFTRY
jgi:hypothetical protein